MCKCSSVLCIFKVKCSVDFVGSLHCAMTVLFKVGNSCYVAILHCVAFEQLMCVQWNHP